MTIEISKDAGASLSTGEKSLFCPKCGSPYVVKYGMLDGRSDTISDFTCTAGDCGYTGAAKK